MSAEERLSALYGDFFSRFQLDAPLAERCSAPLLMSPPEDWASRPLRLLVVGQETLGWGADGDPTRPAISKLPDFLNAEDAVAAMQAKYRRFDFGRNYYHSPFWRVFRQFCAVTGSMPLWANLFRFSVDELSVLNNTSTEDQQRLLSAQHGLLRAEIEVLAPSAVIFLTGRHYDPALRSEFPDERKSAVANQDLDKFAQLTSAGLPPMSFRTYHPNYLQRSKQWHLIDMLCRLVTAEQPVP